MGLLPSQNACKPSPSRKRHKVSSRKKMCSFEQKERKKLIKELDKYVSVYVRYTNSDKQGYATCYTCGKRLPWRLVDNGHWQSRRYQKTRWDLSNMRVQCRNCNRYMGGNYQVYTPKIIKELGEEKAEEIKRLAHSGGKVTTEEMRVMLADIKKKLDKETKIRKSKGWV